MTSGPLDAEFPITPLAGPVDASVRVPGSKSHTNRALVCAALAEGQSMLRGVLLADDTEAMMSAIEPIGAAVERFDDDAAGPGVTVTGRSDVGNAGALQGEVTGGDSSSSAVNPVTVDVRQSGTTGRFLLAVLAGLSGNFVLDGDPQLRRRPFGPQLEALRASGALIDGEHLPLTITGRTMPGGTVEVSGDVSSQFLSGLLLAAPLASAPTELVVPGSLVSKPYVELTLATMADFGLTVDHDGDFTRFVVPASAYKPADVHIEPDASAASYFFGAAAVNGGRIRVEGLGRSTVQGDLNFVNVLARMGCKVQIAENYTEVERVSPLNGVEVDMSDISDTVQTLAVVASQATSPTTITGVGFIRNKETDRLAATATELQRLGIACRETEDGLVIEPGPPRPGVVQTYDDHRMAMSFALLGLRHDGIVIANPSCVGKTFPRFFDVLDELRPALRAI